MIHKRTNFHLPTILEPELSFSRQTTLTLLVERGAKAAAEPRRRAEMASFIFVIDVKGKIMMIESVTEIA